MATKARKKDGGLSYAVKHHVHKPNKGKGSYRRKQKHNKKV